MATLFTLLLGVSAAILAYFLYNFGRQDFLRETEAAIDAEISILATIPRTASSHGELRHYLDNRVKHDPHVFYRLEDSSGKSLAGNIDIKAEDVGLLKEGVLQFSINTGASAPKNLAAKIHTFSDNGRVLVARDIGDLVHSYDRFKVLSAVVLLLMSLVVLVSFAISHFVVSRINRIAVTAHDIITTKDISQRIPIDTQWDDLSNLAQLLNGLFAQLEELMMGMRQVSNNIAHDLKTPLAGLRSDIEALKGKAVDDHQLDALIAEVDQIMRLFHSLLRIANIEQGQRHQAFGAVDVCSVMHDVMELYEPLAEEKAVRFQTNMPHQLIAMGDTDLLFQLFANLLDNAVKFSPEGAAIHINLSKQAERPCVVVADQGVGIPDAEKEKVFRHFYRGDASRSTQGHGLGLSLARAVVEQHHGEIQLHDGQPGLRVVIFLQPYQ